jgi:hypothetical protein
MRMQLITSETCLKHARAGPNILGLLEGSGDCKNLSPLLENWTSNLQLLQAQQGQAAAFKILCKCPDNTSQL